MARAYNSGRRPQWPSTVREVVENIEPVNGKVVGYPTPTVGGPGAPSCYRVSLLSGSLEVTARLKSADDLELLVKVLEANKPLFAKVDRLATEVLTLTQEAVGEFTIAVLSPVRSRSAGLVASVAICDEMLRPLLTICDLFPLLLIPLNSWRFLTQLAWSQSSIYEQIRVSSRGP